MACAVLHNIALILNDVLEEEDEEEEEVSDDDEEIIPFACLPGDGEIVRAYVIEQLFN